MKELNWILTFLGLIKEDEPAIARGPKGDKGDKGDVGPQGPKGSSSKNKKVKVGFNEINIRNQSTDDYFLVFEDKLAENQSDDYTLGSNLEHSFFTQDSKNDIDYLRMLIVSSDNTIVKQLKQEDFSELVKEKIMVPGATFHSLEIVMTMPFIKKHLSNMEDRIIMLFVGDKKREKISNEMNQVDYLFLKVDNLEKELKTQISELRKFGMFR
jgi:hypothetical protein